MPDAQQNAEMIATYQRVMDDLTIIGPINIRVGNGDPDSIARGVGESLRNTPPVTPVQPPPTHASPMPARALNRGPRRCRW